MSSVSPSPALSAAPANALLIWTDGRSIFTELPGPNARPHVIRYPLTSSGLSSALGLIRAHAFDSLDPTSTALHLSPLTPRAGTCAQQLNARDVLRRMRIIP